MNLNSATAIITGASRGLGLATAKALVNKGAIVYGIARNANTLDALKSTLGNSFKPVAIDITNREKVSHWFDATFSADHTPDILINNAGAGNFGNIEELPFEEWQKMIDTNLNGMYHLTSSVVPLIKQSMSVTHIINIGSILGLTGRSESSAYCTTKFGIQGFTKALRKELRYDGIKVSAIHPGSIETDFFTDSGIDPHPNMLQPNDISDMIIAVLETPDNMLVDEITIRPLNPQRPN